MQSGIEDNNPNVKELESEIKFIEEQCKYEKVSIPSDTQVETENLTNVPEKDQKVLLPCLKARNSFDDIETTDTHNQIHHGKSLLKNKAQTSDSNLTTKPTGFSKILTWDPWHKIGRNKNKKDKVERKNEEKKEKMTVSNHNTGDGLKTVVQNTQVDEDTIELDPYITDLAEGEDNLNPKPPKIRKIVRFHADVKVVHYANDEILGQTIEPLKKELEQQERNKELRKEFSPEMGLGLKQSLKVKKSASDYMAAWYKK